MRPVLELGAVFALGRGEPPFPSTQLVVAVAIAMAVAAAVAAAVAEL